jgi:hypothetical protein
MYDEDDVMDGTNPAFVNGSGVPYNEIVNARDDRAANNVAIFGYSRGGGAVRDLAAHLNDQQFTNPPIMPAFTSYIDGVESLTAFAENDRPVCTFHLNLYQPDEGFWPEELNGGPVPVLSGDEQYNVATHTYYDR